MRAVHCTIAAAAAAVAVDAQSSMDDPHCGCAALEPDHQFTVDCADTAAFAAAEATLNDATQCAATTASCASSVGGMKVCQTAFFVLQAHHDFCAAGTLTQRQRDVMVEFEAACMSCTINRPPDDHDRLPTCNVPDCGDTAPAIAASNTLNANCCSPRLDESCTQARCCETLSLQEAFMVVWEYHTMCDDLNIHSPGYWHIYNSVRDFRESCQQYIDCSTAYNPMVCPPELGWAGVFNIAAASLHTWWLQGSWANGRVEFHAMTMRLVLFSTDAPTATTMESLETAAASLITSEACVVVEDGGSMTPAAGGSCFDLHVSEAIGSYESSYTIDTTGMTLSGVVVFAQHDPAEFVRDAHYLRDSSGTDVQPIAIMDMFGTHQGAEPTAPPPPPPTKSHSGGTRPVGARYVATLGYAAVASWIVS